MFKKPVLKLLQQEKSVRNRVGLLVRCAKFLSNDKLKKYLYQFYSICYNKKDRPLVFVYTSRVCGYFDINSINTLFQLEGEDERRGYFTKR